MNKRQTLIFASLASALLMLAVAIGLVVPFFMNDPTAIDIEFSASRPDDSGEDVFSENLILANREAVSNVEVRPDNLPMLISTLSRPSSYYAEITSTVVSDDLQAVYESRKWSAGDIVKIVSSDSSGEEYNYLQTVDTVYSWKAGDLSCNALPRGDFTENSLVRIPTYEVLSQVEEQRILSCGTDNFKGYDCVYAVVSYPEFGYEEKYMISIDYGLLLSAETMKNGRRIYSMSMISLSFDEFEEDPFQLPDLPGV